MSSEDSENNKALFMAQVSSIIEDTAKKTGEQIQDKIKISLLEHKNEFRKEILEDIRIQDKELKEELANELRTYFGDQTAQDHITEHHDVRNFIETIGYVKKGIVYQTGMFMAKAAMVLLVVYGSNMAGFLKQESDISLEKPMVIDKKD
jgi:hypothetical protein